MRSILRPPDAGPKEPRAPGSSPEIDRERLRAAAALEEQERKRAAASRTWASCVFRWFCGGCADCVKTFFHAEEPAWGRATDNAWSQPYMRRDVGDYRHLVPQIRVDLEAHRRAIQMTSNWTQAAADESGGGDGNDGDDDESTQRGTASLLAPAEAGSPPPAPPEGDAGAAGGGDGDGDGDGDAEEEPLFVRLARRTMRFDPVVAVRVYEPIRAGEPADTEGTAWADRGEVPWFTSTEVQMNKKLVHALKKRLAKQRAAGVPNATLLDATEDELAGVGVVIEADDGAAGGEGAGVAAADATAASLRPEQVKVGKKGSESP